MTTLTMDDLVTALSTARRRRVIRELDAAGEQTIRALAETLATASADGRYDADDRKAAYVALYQSHLPKLETLGVIEWSGSSRDPITPAQDFDTVVEALDALEDVLDDTPRIAAFLTGVLSRDGDDTGNAEVFTGP